MSHEDVQQLEATVIDVLEQMAFMFAEGTPKQEMPSQLPPLLRVDIQFSGEASGNLTLVSAQDICQEMAANILGTEPDGTIPAKHTYDALKELTNVVCGRLLTAAVGEISVCNLSPPVLSKPDADTWRRLLADDLTACFMVDELPLLARLTWLASGQTKGDRKAG